ncbi:hypothetical protein TNCV_2578861 [Trichonephila clavipes]|nr:hypothetical protein TNCV_2578861 [Trichonephila clavipes]
MVLKATVNDRCNKIAFSAMNFTRLDLTPSRGCGSPVVKVSDHGMHVMSLSPVLLSTRCVGQRCALNLSIAQTRCGVIVWCQLRCPPRHLNMVQNYVDQRQKPLCS